MVVKHSVHYYSFSIILSQNLSSSPQVFAYDTSLFSVVHHRSRSTDTETRYLRMNHVKLIEGSPWKN